MNQRMSNLGATAAVLLWAGGAVAADLYVATNGTDQGSRDQWSYAYTNVQDALNAATHGDTIYLAGHLFAHTNSLSWSNRNNLAIKGGYEADPGGASPGNRDSAQWPTVIRQTASGQRVLTITTVSSGLMEQLTFTGGSNVSEGAGIRLQAATGIAMDQCRITDNLSSSSGAAGGGIWMNNTCSLAMTNCVVRRNAAHATGGNWTAAGAGIYSQGALRMVDCVLAENNNSRNGVGHEYGGGLYSSGTTVLDNCLVYGNTARKYADGLYANGGTLTMLNCTVAHNGKHGLYRNAGTVNATNTIVWGHYQDVVGTVSLAYCNTESGVQAGESGNISADPLFEFGYYLGEGSLSRDGGTGGSRLTSAPFSTHADGSADSGTVDMGYHYSSAADTSVSNLYVATTGDDMNAGTNPVAPLRSLTAALAKAKQGTRIQIGAGIYTNGIETMPIQAVNLNGVTIEGAGQGETVLHGLDRQPLVMRVYQVQNTVISDISITGGYTNNAGDTKGAGLYVGSASVEFWRCAVTNNYMGARPAQGSGVFVDIGSFVKLTDSLVADNRIYTWGGGWGCYGAGIYNGGTLLARDSRLVNNNNAVANIGLERGGALFSAGISSLRNCLLSGNTATDYADAFFATTVNGYGGGGELVSLENCTLAYNGRQAIYTAVPVPMTNTIIWGHTSDFESTNNVTPSHCNTESGYGAGTNGNLSADPLFEFGYYLGDGSPSRDTGTGGVALLEGDYTTRVTGEPDAAPVDMGYHYFTNGGPDLSYAVLYVAVDGNDANDGTNAAAPLRSLTAGLSKVIAGGTIYMGPGGYTTAEESFPIMVQDLSGLTIEGDPSGETVIDASGTNQRLMAIQNVNNGAFRNLTLTGGYLNLGAGGEERAGGVAVAASTVSFTDCVISNNYLRTLTALGGGLSIDAGSSVVMTRCRVVTNTVVSRQGNWPSQGAGIYNAGVLHMYACIVANNNNDVPNTANRGGGLYNAGVAALRNCLAYGNRATTAGSGFYAAGGTLAIENGTIANHPAQGIHRQGGTVALTNCIVWANGDDLTGTISVAYCNIGSADVFWTNGVDGCMSADPLLTATNAADYRLLLRESPCVNQGLNIVWMTADTDLGGGPRIRSGRVDIGAYECQAASGSLFVVQ